MEFIEPSNALHRMPNVCSSAKMVKSFDSILAAIYSLAVQQRKKKKKNVTFFSSHFYAFSWLGFLPIALLCWFSLHLRFSVSYRKQFDKPFISSNLRLHAIIKEWCLLPLFFSFSHHAFFCFSFFYHPETD